MNSDKCRLCRRPSHMSYEVDSEKPTPLCGECFGKHDPGELNKLLGVTPDDEKSSPAGENPPRQT